MQRTQSKTAIRLGKKNDLNGFFKSLIDVTKYRDLNGVPIEHKQKLKELCIQFESKDQLNGEQICQAAKVVAYLNNDFELGKRFMSKALIMEPHNESLMKENIYLMLCDYEEEQAQQEFESKKGDMKDTFIRDELEKMFEIKKQVQSLKQEIITLQGHQNWIEAGKKIDEGIQATGGLNEYNLEMYRFKLDSLKFQPNKQIETAEFFLTLTKQNPSQIVYYKSAAQKYLEVGMKNDAIKAYSEYYQHELDDILEFDRYLDLLDKSTKVKTLENILSNKIASHDQKSDVVKRLSDLGGNIKLASNDSDEEEYIKKEQERTGILSSAIKYSSENQFSNIKFSNENTTQGQGNGIKQEIVFQPQIMMIQQSQLMNVNQNASTIKQAQPQQNITHQNQHQQQQQIQLSDQSVHLQQEQTNKEQQEQKENQLNQSQNLSDGKQLQTNSSNNRDQKIQIQKVSIESGKQSTCCTIF